MESRFNQAACSEFEALLEDHLTGELSGADAKKLAEHLENCAACSTALEHAAPSVELLRSVPPSPDPGPGFSRVVMARIRAEMSRRGEQKSIWQPFISLAWRFAATATLALAVLVTFDAVRHIQYGPQTDRGPQSGAEHCKNQAGRKTRIGEAGSIHHGCDLGRARAGAPLVKHLSGIHRAEAAGWIPARGRVVSEGAAAITVRRAGHAGNAVPAGGDVVKYAGRILRHPVQVWINISEAVGSQILIE